MEEKDYIKRLDEFIKGGLSEEKSKRYNCSVELYYKAFIQLLDFIILIEKDIITENHKHRNELLRKIDEDLENIRVRVHTIYRGTYRVFLNKRDCLTVKNAIKQAAYLKRMQDRVKESLAKIS
jgi:hypothetical protein